MSTALNFEVYRPVRSGRAHQIGPQVRLTQRTKGNGGGTFRFTRDALALVSIDPKRGDHDYFLVEIDRESGAVRFTPTDDKFAGRLMNPMNRQISLPSAFFEWTGWGTSHWVVEAIDGSLVGVDRLPFGQETSEFIAWKGRRMMKNPVEVWMIWVALPDEPDVAWLVESWDEYSIENNPNGWDDAVKKARAENDEIRVMKTSVPYDDVLAAFAPVSLAAGTLSMDRKTDA